MKSQLILKDKTIYIGEIKNNKPHGRGVIQEDNYAPHGKGKLFTVYNGDISVGEFKNGLLIKGKIYYGQTKKWIKWPPKK